MLMSMGGWRLLDLTINGRTHDFLLFWSCLPLTELLSFFFRFLKTFLSVLVPRVRLAYGLPYGYWKLAISLK